MQPSPGLTGPLVVATRRAAAWSPRTLSLPGPAGALAVGLALLPGRAGAQPAPLDPVSQAAELSRFRTGSRLATAGGYVTMAGGGVGLAGLIAAAGGYNPTGTYLSYGGSGLWALGFCLEAGGVSMQHNAAERLGLDPGRGLFVTGTTLGALGLASTAASLYVGATDHFGDKNLLATLSFMAGGLVFVTVARVLYAFDERRLARALSGSIQF